MPTFSSFKRENELCDKYAGEDGALHFESDADFENLIRQLMPEYQHSFITSKAFLCVCEYRAGQERAQQLEPAFAFCYRIGIIV